MDGFQVLSVASCTLREGKMTTLRRDIVKRIFLTVLAALLMGGVTKAQAQVRTPTPGLIACDPGTIPAMNKGYPVWGPDRAGVSPVMPEVLDEVRKGRNPLQVVAEAIKRERNLDRISMFNRIQAFTPPDTLMGEIPGLPKEFAEAFEKALRVENLEESTIECGDLIHYVTSAAPDRMEGSKAIAQIHILPAHVLGWCEQGVVGPNGKCAVRVVQTKSLISLTSGVNAGSSYRFQMILNCGNPNAKLEVPNITTEVPALMPPPDAPPSPPHPSTAQEVPKPEPRLYDVWGRKVFQSAAGKRLGENDVSDRVWSIRFSATDRNGLKYDAYPQYYDDQGFVFIYYSVPLDALPLVVSEDPATQLAGFEDKTGKLKIDLKEESYKLIRVPAEPEYVNQARTVHTLWIPCITGKRNKWACLGILGLGAALIPRGQGAPPPLVSTPQPPLKTGGPGS